MAKEMERLGLPTVHVCTVIPISQTVGANRILPAVAIPYPTGDPSMPADDELKLRVKMMARALEALGASIQEQTVY